MHEMYAHEKHLIMKHGWVLVHKWKQTFISGSGNGNPSAFDVFFGFDLFNFNFLRSSGCSNIIMCEDIICVFHVLFLYGKRTKHMVECHCYNVGLASTLIYRILFQAIHLLHHEILMLFLHQTIFVWNWKIFVLFGWVSTIDESNKQELHIYAINRCWNSNNKYLTSVLSSMIGFVV